MLKRVLAVAGALVLLLAIGIVATWADDKTVEELSARWAPPPSVFLTVDGLRVHLRDEGPKDDPEPLIMLHGTSSSLHTWEGWASALRETHRVVRMDLPGFGLTGPDPKDDYSMPRYVRFVHAVMDSLHIARAVLIGNSLGGGIAWNTALADTSRVSRLVLVDAMGFPNNSTSVPIGFRIARIPLLGGIMRSILPRSIVASSVKSVFGDPSKVTPALIDRYYELTLREGNRRAVVARFQQSAVPLPVDKLGTLQMPTLIMWGNKDGLIAPTNAEKFRMAIPHSRTATFTSLGHIPQEEDPVATLRLLQPFLNERTGLATTAARSARAR